MKIHSLCIAKDEADIIEQTLRSATHWSDFIYFYDNGSQDGTWEKAKSLSQELPQIILYRQDDRPFHNGLRSEMFNHFRESGAHTDWWCRLDADEIYIDNPRTFLAKVEENYLTVWSASFQYYLTDLDAAQFDQNPDKYADTIPVEQKCRYYINNWSEIRFFRDHPGLEWRADERWPVAAIAGRAYPHRIWLKHYQYRSPQQIQRRLEVRQAARAKGSISFVHEVQTDWQTTTLPQTQSATKSQAISQPAITASLEHPTQTWRSRLLPANELNYDAHDGHYIFREDLLPTLNPVLERLRARIKLILRATQRFLSKIPRA